MGYDWPNNMNIEYEEYVNERGSNINDQIFSKVAGVTMPPLNKDGISLRQLYLKKFKETGIKALKLIRDPDNPFDQSAIQVAGNFGAGVVVLGFVQNSQRECSCGKVYKKGPNQPDTCSCGLPLMRNGLATTLAQLMDEGVKFSARITAITGGPESGEDRAYGCNICIDRVL